MARNYKRWDELEVDFLRHNAKFPITLIARALDRGVSSVAIKASKLGIQLRKSKDIDWVKVSNEYAQGRTLNQLAEKYNVHPNTISNNVMYRKRSYIDWTKKEEQQLAELYKEYTAKQIAIKMQRTTISINEKARKLGLKKYNVKK